MWLVFDVKDVDAEYKRIQGMGVPIEVALRDEPWGDRHFVLVDPQWNRSGDRAAAPGSHRMAYSALIPAAFTTCA
jgi:hypothetical protein